MVPVPYSDIVVSINSEYSDLVANYIATIYNRIHYFSKLFNFNSFLDITPVELSSIVTHLMGNRNFVFNSFFSNEKNMEAIVINNAYRTIQASVEIVVTYNNARQIDRIITKMPFFIAALKARMNDVLFHNIIIAIENNVPFEAFTFLNIFSFNKKSTLIIAYNDNDEYKDDVIAFSKKIKKSIGNLKIEKDGLPLMGFNLSKSKIYNLC